jgi:hypothetical protein
MFTPSSLAKAEAYRMGWRTQWTQTVFLFFSGRKAPAAPLRIFGAKRRLRPLFQQAHSVFCPLTFGAKRRLRPLITSSAQNDFLLQNGLYGTLSFSHVMSVWSSWW